MSFSEVRVSQAVIDIQVGPSDKFRERRRLKTIAKHPAQRILCQRLHDRDESATEDIDRGKLQTVVRRTFSESDV